MELFIDIMDIEDIDQVMEIERKVFPMPWSQKAFLREITNNPYATYFTASYGRKIVGYIGGWVMKSRLHITNLAVDSEFRRSGVATKLINKLINISKLQKVEKIILEVRVSNKSAISFYEDKGFNKIDRRQNYYKDGEDAFIMWKVIVNE